MYLGRYQSFRGKCFLCLQTTYCYYSITCQTQAVLIEEEVFFRNDTRQLKLMVFLNK